MNIGARLLLSAALAVGSTVGAAALGQNAVRDAQAEVGPSAPPSIPASATPRTGGGGGLGDGTGSGGAADADRGLAKSADSGAAGGPDADAESDAEGEADVDPDDRVAGVRAELAAAAAAGEISWDAAERVSDELGGYIRGDVSVADIA